MCSRFPAATLSVNYRCVRRPIFDPCMAEFACEKQIVLWYYIGREAPSGGGVNGVKRTFRYAALPCIIFITLTLIFTLTHCTNSSRRDICTCMCLNTVRDDKVGHKWSRHYQINSDKLYYKYVHIYYRWFRSTWAEWWVGVWLIMGKCAENESRVVRGWRLDRSGPTDRNKSWPAYCFTPCQSRN